jgi:hypothetical protein
MPQVFGCCADRDPGSPQILISKIPFGFSGWWSSHSRRVDAKNNRERIAPFAETEILNQGFQAAFSDATDSGTEVHGEDAE